MSENRKKRAANADPIFKRGEWWYIDKQIAPRVRIRESLRTRSRDVARRKAFELIRQRVEQLADHGVSSQTTPDLLCNAIASFLRQKEPEVAARTFDSYRTRLSGFAKSVAVETLCRLTGERIEQWYGALRKDAQSGAIAVDTANSLLKTVRQFLGFARSMGWLRAKPRLRLIKVDGVTRRHVHRDVVRKDRFDRLVAALRGTSFEAYAIIAYYGGLRSSEIAQLDWSQVDLKAETILLHSGKTKGGKERVVAIRKTGLVDLERIKQATGPIVSDAPAYPRRSEFSSLLDYGKALRRYTTSLSQTFGRAIAQCAPDQPDLHPIRAHLLRHSYTTLCVEAGVPIALVAASLGHSVSWVTERYCHVQPQGGFAA